MIRPTVKPHIIESTGEDDEDLELVVDSDENDKEDTISQSRFD